MVGNDNNIILLSTLTSCSIYTCMIYDYAATQFDPDSHFTMVALRKLKEFGVINLKNLESYTKHLEDTVGVEATILCSQILVYLHFLQCGLKDMLALIQLGDIFSGLYGRQN